jgi:hypothetical protein
MVKAITPHQILVYVDSPMVSFWNMQRRLSFTAHNVGQKKISITSKPFKTATISASILA